MNRLGQRWGKMARRDHCCRDLLKEMFSLGSERPAGDPTALLRKKDGTMFCFSSRVEEL